MCLSADGIAGMLDTVRSMLQSDGDAQVLANCVTVLTQVLSSWAAAGSGLLAY
jgi:hypothetical protein